MASMMVLWGLAMPLLGLDGQVVQIGGQPLADASVSIVGHPGAARTDSEGRFSWQPTPTPPFEVLVVLQDGRYMAPVLIEELPVDGPLIIIVEPLIAESVTVSASVTPNIEGPPANGMTTVRRRDLVQRNPVRLTDALQNIPGVSTQSDLHTAVPSIRGLSRGRTLILIDGARVTSERRAGPSATYLDPFFLEGIEVSRGPGSVAYGSDAFGGIIHARTRRPVAGEPFHFRFQGTLAAGLPQRSAHLELSQGWTEGGFLLAGRFREFDDYDSPRGKVDNSSASGRGFLARVMQEWGAGVFSLGWQSDFGRSTGRPSTRNSTRRVFQPEENSHRFTVGYDADPVWGFSRLKFDGFVGSYQLITANDNLPSATVPRNIDESNSDAMDYALRGVATRPAGQGRLEFGVDLNGRFNLRAVDSNTLFDLQGNAATVDEQVSIEDARRSNTGLFLSGETALGKILTASAGVRYDRITTRNRGGGAGDRSTSHDAFSGYLALSAALRPGLTLSGQVARGFRDATLSDRYFTGLTGRGFITGNPDLRPEESLQFDFALRYVSRRIRWAVFGYHYRIDDLIERFEDSQDLFFLRNRGRGRLMGLEVELQTPLVARWTLEFGAQTADGRARDDRSPLDDVPVESMTAVLSRPLTARGYLQLRAALFDRDKRPGPSEIVTPGHAVFDIGAGWKLDERFELRFLIKNLLDKDYPTSPDSRSLGAPGISGSVTLVVEM